MNFQKFSKGIMFSIEDCEEVVNVDTSALFPSVSLLLFCCAASNAY